MCLALKSNAPPAIFSFGFAAGALPLFAYAKIASPPLLQPHISTLYQ